MEPMMGQSLWPLSHSRLVTLGFAQEILMGQQSRLAPVAHPSLCLAGSESHGITSCHYTLITRMNVTLSHKLTHKVKGTHGPEMHLHTDTANISNSLWLQWGWEYESTGFPCDQTLMWDVYSLHVFMPESPQEANTEHLDICEHTLSVKLTVDLQHDWGLFSVTTGVGGLAAVDTRVLDDGVVNDESGSWCLRVERHPFWGHNALALRVVPLQPHRLADS